ncbi:carbohydrate sulfotransferase 11-like [Palaemon carinicauda]|uniref:carbohydrate sulfotransferase 11-like n=1 Tax=Palaemon carinicauda TaxID=392227 RepID=UPI0035B5ADD1
MDWAVCGWLRCIRNAVVRKVGSNHSLFSALFFVALFVTVLCIFHSAILNQVGNVGLMKLESPDSISSPKEIAEEVVTGMTEEQETTSQPPSSEPLQEDKKVGRNQGEKAYTGRKKAFNKKFFLKKGPMKNRANKLVIPQSNPERKMKRPPFRIVAKGKPKNTIYQEDVVVGDELEWTKEVEQERREELRRRSLHVQGECENDISGKLRRRMGKVYQHLKWVSNHSLIYCPVFKAGSTTWMKNLLTLAGQKTFDGSLHAKVTSLYKPPKSYKKIENLLKKSLKFMIVRHPFERLLSAYRDKMLRVLKTEDPYRQMQLSILKDYGHVGNNESSPTSGDPNDEERSPQDENSHPTFLQFLYKVRDEMKGFWKIMNGVVVDPHWTPSWYTCAPCQIKYDVIAKMETLDLDQEFILHESKLHDILFNARTHASQFDGYSDTDAAARKYFKDIPLEILKELEELYRPDFKLYGYTADKYYEMTQDGA